MKRQGMAIVIVCRPSNSVRTLLTHCPGHQAILSVVSAHHTRVAIVVPLWLLDMRHAGTQGCAAGSAATAVMWDAGAVTPITPSAQDAQICGSDAAD